MSTVGITDAHERLHPVEDASPHWSDSLYFNAWDPGTDAFNNELGRMTALSYPVITLPVMLVLMGTIYYIFSTVGKLTGLELEEMMKQKPKKGQPAPAIVSEEAGDHIVGEQQSSRS